MRAEDPLDLDQLAKADPAPVRFVHRLAWVFIVLSALTSVYGAYYLTIFFRSWQKGQSPFFLQNDIDFNYSFPLFNWLSDFYLQFQGLIDLAFCLGAMLMVVVAIGLLQHKKIARTIFILLLYLHIFYSLLRMAVVVYFARLAKTISTIDSSPTWSIGEIAQGLLIAYPIYTIVLYFLYRWIHRRLKQEEVLALFK